MFNPLKPIRQYFFGDENNFNQPESLELTSPNPIHFNQKRPKPKTKNYDLKCQIRWLIRRDMAEVLEIEKESFEFAWTEEDFLCCLRQRNCIGMVAEHNQEIMGFMIYELHKSSLHLLNMAVAPCTGVRRKGVGSQMIDKLVDKLYQQKREEVVLEVRETNLAAQLFYKNQGFRAICVLKNHYDDTVEDAYVMRYNLDEHPERHELNPNPNSLLSNPHNQHAWTNRISRYFAA
jgi:[ribosomal protein S18]-alanine N-acetyltransferase